MTKEQKREYAKNKQDANRDEWFENLAKAIESDELPWQKPWVGGHRSMPQNLVSKKCYRGSNIVACWIASMCEGWSDMRFATRKQLMDMGLSVKGLKNGTGTSIMFYKRSEYTKFNEEKGELEVKQSWFSRWYEVWNVEQCENYDEILGEDAIEMPMENTPPSEMMLHFDDYTHAEGITVGRGGGAAFYRRSDDLIQLPKHEAFVDPVSEVMVAMHEAAHSTGHKSRLDRLDNNEYAYEELVAEMAALLVTLSLGGEYQPRETSVAYLQHWLKACRDKDDGLFKAFSDAQKAADRILETE